MPENKAAPMKKILWIVVIVFLLGDGLFVLPWHLTSDNVSVAYYTNYKKDPQLLVSAFPDTTVALQLNMPAGYQRIYAAMGKKSGGETDKHSIIVNVNFLHDLDFSALLFPFYKVTSFHSVIPFSSIIKAENAPGMDSTALIGNIIVTGKLSVTGICTPMYARSLVENKLTALVKQQMDSITLTLNRRDTVQAVPLTPVEQPPVKKKAPMKRPRK